MAAWNARTAVYQGEVFVSVDALRHLRQEMKKEKFSEQAIDLLDQIINGALDSAAAVRSRRL